MYVCVYMCRYEYIGVYMCLYSDIYTYIHIHTYTYTYIHTDWRNGSARRKGGAVPQNEFAYLYRRLKCLTVHQKDLVPQEDKVPQGPQFSF